LWGNVGLRPDGSGAEVGITIAAHARRQGHVAETLAELSRYAFTDRDMQSLRAVVNPEKRFFPRQFLASIRSPRRRSEFANGLRP